MSFNTRIPFFFLATVIPALAGSFYGNAPSAASMGAAGIYMPTNQSPLDALAANPAGLTLLSSKTLDLSLASVFARGEFSNSVNRGAKLDQSPGVIPYGAYGSPIGSSRFAFGVGFLPEMMSSVNWNYMDAPGVGGASYGMQKHKSAILAARTTAGVGVYLGRSVSVGATVGLVYNSNTLQAPYIFQSHPALAGLKTKLDLQTTGTGWNTSVGVMAQPARKLRVGLAWKSKTVIRSQGDATGNLAEQLAAIGLGAARPDFHYSAEVRNVLPQSVLANILWQANSQWRLALQADWVNWKNAFQRLPVSLTGGNNGDINGLLSSDSLADSVPLDWKNQTTYRAGVERLLTENTSLRAGFAHANNPVPQSTVSPLTGAIMRNTLSTGFAYRLSLCTLNLAYNLDLAGKSAVQRSALLSGEYSNSRLSMGTQSVILSTSFRL